MSSALTKTPLILDTQFLVQFYMYEYWLPDPNLWLNSFILITCSKYQFVVIF